MSFELLTYRKRWLEERRLNADLLHLHFRSKLGAQGSKLPPQISRITGMISGRFCVCFEMYRFKSALIFSLITP
jgi:hypothetical protein